MQHYYAIEFHEDRVIILDQTKLPLDELYIVTDDYERIAEAIEKLEVRGAPAIGIAAAYAFALAMRKSKLNGDLRQRIDAVYERLKATRPTAVNLFWALDRMKYVAENSNLEEMSDNLIIEAVKIHSEDIEMCKRIGENGLEIFSEKKRVLTHCNTGKLATGGDGTAFSVIKKAFENGMVKHVFADETRPLLQGSRLTAYELEKLGIPFSINVDSTASVLIRDGMVDLVITGADRIAKNGDSANKIGTYNLAVNCKFHNIPFYIAAPSSTIDLKCDTGNQINIEYREANELTSIGNKSFTKDTYNVFAPAFDVTPAELITGIITDKELYQYPYKF
ncbi:MAG: S-methyl-5-thioribose-1-phosphate isomerase [Melioribacteraceae bacterium]|nr:S-methyl-5-thioribose-1-phosphate isomerase [Melioribacteraceae bacterium]MCF8265463.1 S-methyl-5-thioribose-1-phosphate isomerase [Melioribacteraceae bacterium]MCF8413024.1 S-methyl-5-thioribose-1-phosphate isomerase [Melioribacteraceae bacterium]MCF8432257.1 S-methyl-5-thioribose-1-phosphate isomerase [Melioribacteraceae bacterium]